MWNAPVKRKRVYSGFRSVAWFLSACSSVCNQRKDVNIWSLVSFHRESIEAAKNLICLRSARKRRTQFLLQTNVKKWSSVRRAKTCWSKLSGSICTGICAVICRKTYLWMERLRYRRIHFKCLVCESKQQSLRKHLCKFDWKFGDEISQNATAWSFGPEQFLQTTKIHKGLDLDSVWSWPFLQRLSVRVCVCVCVCVCWGIIHQRSCHPFLFSQAQILVLLRQKLTGSDR